ncbi:translation machinery-associated 64 [Fusarium longipes]|uniref:Translation machinery-associated 64 n=1 Tax=Fusarium longipes TaxID=694270 RepID=A0A395RU86_9HYPO|nr:translation machinery-associated 64 [Fusarium longipes]
MKSNTTYSLADILAVAKLHPFYSDAGYPPDNEALRFVQEKISLQATNPNYLGSGLIKHLFNILTLQGKSSSRPGEAELMSQPLLQKKDLSLDLILEIMENAGASVLAAGSYNKPAETVTLLKEFHVNVLTGDGSQIVAVIHHISTLKEDRDKIKLNKIIYTSEALTAAQKAHIYEVLGLVKICSVLGSVEAGPYGVSTPDIIPSEPGATHNDFIIDTRMTLIEILPLDYAEGVIAQTVLTRLRNPVVRYITGNIGSLHPLFGQARSRIPQFDLPYLRVLRLQGRDRRFSFLWDGDDARFDKTAELLSEEGYGVLQWQVILSKMEPSSETFLEVRLLCKNDESAREAVLACLRTFFNIYPPNEHKFKVTFVGGLDGFELSKTGQKVIKFVDRSEYIGRSHIEGG